MDKDSDRTIYKDPELDQQEEGISHYSDAIYRQVAPSTSAGYSPAHGVSSPDSGHRRRRRTAKFLCILGVVCVVMAALLGLGGTLLVFRSSGSDDAQEDTSSTQELYAEYIAAEESTDDSAMISVLSTEDKEPLSAVEIYEAACRSVVGVAISGESYNIFGQTSSNSVTGTGIILTGDGYILTNYHVIENAYLGGSDIQVMTFDGDGYEAQIVGVETDNDLAVLKIEAEDLEPAELGDSDEMMVGQTIYTIGNPLGELTYTMTSGIVSALDREVTTDLNVTVHMFQIDAAVNDGNSGGPVLNEYGQVIGVVTAKYSDSGVEGLGFAIPMTEACEIANDIMVNGYVTGKAYLGLTMSTVSESVARFYDMVPGVYVSAVEPGSCSETAGIKAGDIITAIDGIEVTANNDLVQAVKQYSAGDSAVLTIYRDGRYLMITVVFDEELPASKDQQNEGAPLSGKDLIEF